MAFAYAGNQAFVTVMCEMRNPSKDYTPAIIWLNVIAVPLYVIIGCVVYNFSGQYVVAPALGSAPGVPSQVAYGILIPTMLGSGLVFGHTAIKFMYNFVMDTMIKSKAKLTDNTFLTWGVWLGCGTLFWVVAFVFANAIPAFNSILGISSALFVTWYDTTLTGILESFRPQTNMDSGSHSAWPTYSGSSSTGVSSSQHGASLYSLSSTGSCSSVCEAQEQTRFPFRNFD